MLKNVIALLLTAVLMGSVAFAQEAAEEQQDPALAKQMARIEKDAARHQKMVELYQDRVETAKSEEEKAVARELLDTHKKILETVAAEKAAVTAGDTKAQGAARSARYPLYKDMSRLNRKMSLYKDVQHMREYNERFSEAPKVVEAYTKAIDITLELVQLYDKVAEMENTRQQAIKDAFEATRGHRPKPVGDDK